MLQGDGGRVTVGRLGASGGVGSCGHRATQFRHRGGVHGVFCQMNSGALCYRR
jgi:hypothetical protein